jgi:endonuclease/exonuclease/phosphatase family metal-dependent hydrolase
MGWMRAVGLLTSRPHTRQSGGLVACWRAVLSQQALLVRASCRHKMHAEPRAKRARTTLAPDEGETDKAWRKRLRVITNSSGAGNGHTVHGTSVVTTTARRLGSADSDTDLHCPFADKDVVKTLGAQFDWERKLWYVPEGADLQPFERWLPPEACSAVPEWHDYPNRRSSAASLRILSWNIAELIPSQAAPEEWGPNSQLRCVRRSVRTERPDVLLLQECPTRSFELDLEGYVRCGSTSSHCGYVCTYVRRDLKRSPGTVLETTPGVAAVEPTLEVAQVVAFPDLPAVGVLLSLDDVGTLCVVNCHLAPHGSGASTRAEQIAAIGTALSNAPKTAVPDAVLLAGDCNMRNHEVEPTGRPFGDFAFPLRHCRYEGHR